MFYGQDQSTPIQDVVASFIASLVGTLPQKGIKMIFVKSKPKQKDVVTQIMESNNVNVDKEKYQKVSALRMELYAEMYKLPGFCREIGWGILLTVSVAAFCIAVE